MNGFCLCSHHQGHHLNYSDSCIHWNDCGCQAYVEDVEPDDQKYPTPAPFSNSYAGIYAKKYDLEEPA